MHSLTHHHFWFFIGLLIVAVCLFGSTNAQSVPAYMMIVAFLVLSSLFWALWYGFLSFIGIYGIKLQRKRRLALIASLVSSGLLALQSIGQLSTRDIMLVVFLLALAYAYSLYAKTDRRDFGR